MKTAVFIIVFLAAAAGAFAQTDAGAARDRSPIVNLCLPDRARYEIVSLEPSLDWSERKLKLDRYTGKTFFYYAAERRWYPLVVRGGLPNESGNMTPKYQIYADAELVFLINHETGQSWVLSRRAWEPVAN